MNLEPPPHDGVNLWVMSSARKCQIAGLSEGEAEQAIMAFQGQTRRPIKQNEVIRAIQKAYNTTLAPSASYTPAPKLKWEPSKTRQSRYRSVPVGFAAVDIWEASPDVMDGGVTQKMILDWLFPDPDGLVCVGKSAYEFYTAPISKFKNLMETQFIVPCYMTKREGVTQDGKPSMHCLDNTGPRRYCVVDLDEPSASEHPSIIWQIRKTFDLVMVLSSGGKGLHAWFNVPEDVEEDFWDSVIPLGADPALMRNRSSFVRMPMGLRDNGMRQGVLYFDHTKCKA